MIARKKGLTETYKQATIRLLNDLSARGWTISDPNLKVPWAEKNEGIRIWFKPESTYLNDRSLWLDRRGMLVDDLILAAILRVPDLILAAILRESMTSSKRRQ